MHPLKEEKQRLMSILARGPLRSLLLAWLVVVGPCLPVEGFGAGPAAKRLPHADWLQDSQDVSSDASPQIDQLAPAQAAAGSEVLIEIDGRNFAKGAYVSLS